MPKWGYAIIFALTAVLAGYVFWPTGAPTAVAVFPQPLPAAFTVTGELGDQIVSTGKVRVATLERSADAKAVAGFRSLVERLTVAPTQVVEEIDVAAAHVYGIDGSHRLTTADEVRTWGTSSSGGAVHDPKRRRLMLVAAADIDQLTAAAARLDVARLVELPPQIDRLTVDGVTLARTANIWQYPGHLRPPAAERITSLLRLIVQTRLAHINSMPTAATAEHTFDWRGQDGHEQHLRLMSHAGSFWLVIDGVPPQVLSPQSAEQWRAACLALAADWLCDRPPMDDLLRAIVQRDGDEKFRLERRGEISDDVQRPWAVIWHDGDEPAADNAGERIEAAIRGLIVTTPIAGNEPTGSGTTAITLQFRNDQQLRLVLSDSHAWSDGWIGTVGALPDPLDHLQPDTFFDLRPCPIDPDRVVKLQRRWPSNVTRDEVMSRPSKGTWERRWPNGAIPADEFAVERVVKTLCRLRAQSVRLRIPDEQLPPTEAEISIRVEARPPKRVTIENEVELADTMVQNRGWTLHHQNNQWLLAEIGGSLPLMYTLNAVDAEALLVDVSSNRLFPIAPSLVAAIEVGGDRPFKLRNMNDSWVLIWPDNTVLRADDVSVRKLLRSLIELTTTANVEPPAHGIAIDLVTQDNQRIAITVGSRPQGTAGLAVTTVHGSRLLSDLTAWSLVDLRPETYWRKP